jgi:peptidoglycan/xylan/chitin deacetylase (PgdA/CDA1 family)
MQNQERTSFQTYKALSIKSNGTRNSNTHNRHAETADKLLNRPKVLMYHRVVDDIALSRKQNICVHVQEFHKQLELLDRLGFTAITLSDYRLYQAGEIRLPRKPVIITFDDGYLDTYRLAVPLLKEYGMRAVVFVIGDRSIKTNVWDDNRSDISKAALMNTDQIVEIHQDGFEIGVHTLTHSALTDMPDEDCIEEIKNAKTVLEAVTGSTIYSFSYPYGKVNRRIKKYVFESGYQYACSVFSGPPRFGDDPLEIRRITVSGRTSILGFALRLVGPYEYAEWLWWKSRNGSDS